MNFGTQSMIQLFNTIRSGHDGNGTAFTPAGYREIVPEANLQNIAEVGNPILNIPGVRNQFLDALIDRIGITIVRNGSFRNPLKALKGATIPMGFGSQEIYSNPAIGEEYTEGGYTADGVFKGDRTDGRNSIVRPDTKVVYHHVNRQWKYPVSINESMLRRAFISYEAFGQFFNSILNTIVNGDEIDEFRLMKGLINVAVKDGGVNANYIGNVTDKDTAEHFIQLVRQYVHDFQEPSSDFNAWGKLNPNSTPCTVWTESTENMVLLIRSDIASLIDVKVLANAFQLDKDQFLSQQIVVTNFGKMDDADNIMAILCDRAFFKVEDVLYTMESDHNAANLITKYFLHHHQVYSYSPMVNAVAFCVAEPTNPNLSGINITGSIVSPSFAPDNYNYTATTMDAAPAVTVTTMSSTSVVEISDGTTTYQNGAAVPLVEGVNTLTITSTNGADVATYTITTIYFNTLLTSLSSTALTLVPAFSSGNTLYTATTSASADVISASAQSTAGVLTLTVNGFRKNFGDTITYTAGVNEVIVGVKNGNFSRNYVVRVTRS